MDRTASAVMTTLVEAGNIDAVYRDVYVERARRILAPLLSLEDFHRLEHQRAALAQLPVTIAGALDTGNWPLVKELSEDAETLRHVIDDQGGLLQIARNVYDVRDVRLDPFSPGLEPFTLVPRRDFATLRTRVLGLLGELETTDGAWSDFYAARRRAFEAQPQWTLELDTASTSETDAFASARQALKSGDMKRLAALAGSLATSGARAGSSSLRDVNVGCALADAEPSKALPPVAYSSETLARARALGLAPRHVERRTELASLRRYAWTPLSNYLGNSDVAQVPVPSGSPEGLQEGVAVFAIHPLVNSGGARYLPSLVPEDVLVEDFPDPADGGSSAPSELVKRLGLPGRRGVPRIAIEHALLAHGAGIVEQELGLDPRVFRLVCIPPDVYVRLGEAEGWGRHPFWTHFDGYLVRRVAGQTRLQALAGGDVRYGGIYDLLGVGREYDSDRLLVRFAVVMRARMVAW